MKNVTPLPSDTDFSVEKWLAQTSYTLVQKEHFETVLERLLSQAGEGCQQSIDVVTKIAAGSKYVSRTWADQLSIMINNWCEKYYHCKSFGKTEIYMQFKHVRWINSRSDEFKVLSGPIFSQIEHSLFTNPHIKNFIKKVPVTDRSAYIDQMMFSIGGVYFATDYSAFESSFSPELIKACEMQLYKYMVKNCPDVHAAIGIIEKALTMKQICRSRACRVTTYSRMSGDMCTSLGNGFTNLMVASFWAQENGFDVCGVVEGDDGLFRVPSEDLIPPVEFYEKLGFIIKMDKATSLNEGGFCKVFYAPGEPENLREPFEVILKAGWTMSQRMHGGDKVLKELTRSKCFSLLCETPSCPVLSSFALWLYRATEGSEPSPAEGWWDKQFLKGCHLSDCVERANKGPTPGQRAFVESFWKVPIAHQLHIENYFDSLSNIQPITDPIVLMYCVERFPDWHVAYETMRAHKPTGSAW